ncbi:hydroxyacid dehydrogenase [Plantactinospora siamensis]|uniref:Hydroxyacid dehydrogenase n=1 Tax=Plantactinospora siamensis TaxID=555372 RepID=A0ABV6NTH2_9ACTN
MPRSTIVVDIADALVADLFDPDLRARLDALGTVVDTGGTADDARRFSADVAVTGWGSRAFPGTLPPSARLRFVVHSAGTIRQLVPHSLIAGGLAVSQATAGMARSVAELALAFTLALPRDLQRVAAVMRGCHDWHAAQPTALGRAVCESTVGVVGASRIGRIYIELVRALGATVLVYDPYLSDADAAALGARPSTLEALMSASDVVALHAPVTAQTRGMITAALLASMRDGACLVNTARSAIVDMPALERELVSGRIRGALDVFDLEPLPPDYPLFGLPNVILTPHLGAVTTASRRHQGLIVVEEIERFLAGRPLRHAVTAESYGRLA